MMNKIKNQIKLNVRILREIWGNEDGSYLVYAAAGEEGREHPLRRTAGREWLRPPPDRPGFGHDHATLNKSLRVCHRQPSPPLAVQPQRDGLHARPGFFRQNVATSARLAN